MKVMAQRTDLGPSRVFAPNHIKDSRRPLPLVIMVHGGGFMMNLPCVDDPLARYLADHSDCLVTSIDYRKAPTYQFPAAYEDIVESILALLSGSKRNQPSIDESRIILCGSSSGGNLVLAAAQDPRLCGKLLGVIAISPVVNLLLTEAEQMATRPDPTVPDFLKGMWDILIDLYVGTNEAQILKDPRLSPMFFKSRDNLPRHIFLIGLEHDMLCHETEIMAEKLADDKLREKTKDGWRAADVQWKMVKGQPHGFENFAKKNAQEEQARGRAKAAMYGDIAQWLRTVLKTNASDLTHLD